MKTEHPSVCPLDCPDTCSLTVTVEDERIVSIKGSRANPYTAGVLCAKVPEAYPGFVHGDGRLKTPLRRTGAKGEGRFERISWAQALDIIHERFTAVIAAHGPQAILPLNYAGPHGMLAGGSMDLRFFHRLGASLLDRRPLCGGIRTEAWVGTFGPTPGIRPEQAEHSKLIVAWGSNVTWSNLHVVPIINRARRAGAKLVIVDTRRTKIAEQADLHLAIRPGTDVILAWAMAADLERQGGLDREFIARHVDGFEDYMALARRYTLADAARICGVEERLVQQFAEWYRTISPAVITVGNGLERNKNGGSGIRAVFALPALAGKFGVPGGGLINGAGFAFPKTPARLARPDFVPAGTRLINIIDVGRHLNDPTMSPPLKALFIYNHNPLVVHPEQNVLRRGLEREDLFVVGSDVVMTDSLAYADVVLPACSHFEHADLFAAYGTHWLQRADRVIPPQGEALPNTEIFRRLAARFGYDDPAFRASDGELMDDALDGADPRMGGKRPSAIPLDRAHADDGRRRCRGSDPVQERVPQDDVGQGRARVAVPRRQVRRAPAELAAGRVVLSADADLTGFGPAHHVDLRRAPRRRRPAAARDAPGRCAGAEPARRHAGARVERPRRGAAAAAGHRDHPPGRRLHAQGRLDGDQRQRPDHLGAVPGRPRRHFRGRLLQRRARRSGGPLRTRP